MPSGSYKGRLIETDMRERFNKVTKWETDDEEMIITIEHENKQTNAPRERLKKET